MGIIPSTGVKEFSSNGMQFWLGTNGSTYLWVKNNFGANFYTMSKDEMLSVRPVIVIDKTQFE